LLARVSLATAVSVLAAVAGSGAVREPLHFTRYGVSEGLSDTTVRDLLQDRRGFIWVATWAGLDRFDGVRFRVYRHHQDEPGSLSDDSVWTLFEDRDENLWVGTATGVNLYDPRSDRFSRLHLDSGDGTPLDDALVYSIVQDRSGALWMGAHAGLIRFDPASGRAKRYQPDPGDAGAPGADAIWDLLLDSHGGLWLGTEGKGLGSFDPETGVFTYHRPHPHPSSSLSHSIVRALAQDPDGSIWVGTQGGLDRLEPGTGELVHYGHDPDDPTSLSSNAIRALLVDREGVLWVGTSGGGLDRHDPERGGFVHARHNGADQTSLASDIVYSLLEDAAGDLWIGNLSGGLHFLDRHDSGFEHIVLRDDGARIDLVSSLVEDPDGTLWLGTVHGLLRLDARSGGFVQYRHDDRDPDSLGANTVLCLERDRQGVLWVGTYSGGLNRLEAGGLFTRFQHDPTDPTSLSNSTVQTVLEDSAGTLWVGTNAGLNRLHRETGGFTRYGHDNQHDSGPPHDDITFLYEDRDKRLWIGTRAGLSRYDRTAGRFVSFDAIAGLAVWAIFQDSAGYLWVGTRGDGLKRLDPQRDIATTYREADGLSSDLVAAILEDERGHLWVSTQAGLSDFDPKTGQFVNYDSSAGLQAGQFLRGSALRSRSGALLFGGEDGFNRFRPEAVRRNPYVPPIVITGFRLFNAPVPISPDGPLSRRIDEASEVRLAYDQSVFSFDFAALSYRNPGKNRYAYKLEGFDRDWVESGTRSTATYTNLDAGEYLFRVKGSNGSGVWNQEGTSIRVVITPPFWETWWFEGAALLALVAVILGVHLLRTRSIRQRNRLLQREIDQRTEAEAEQERLLHGMRAANLALEESNVELAARNAELDRFAYTVSHDLQSPLVTIGGFVGLLARDAKAGDLDRVEKDVGKISTATETMQALLRELLALSRAGRRASPPREIDLNELVQDAIALLEKPLIERGIEVHVAPGLPRVYGDRVRLLEVFQNLLDNAAKFMGDQRHPHVEIEAASDADGVVCRVRDNGVGIEPRYHQRVFGLFDRLDPDTEGTGVGLAIVRQIIEAHRGKIWIESTGEGGTAFCFVLPHKST